MCVAMVEVNTHATFCVSIEFICEKSKLKQKYIDDVYDITTETIRMNNEIEKSLFKFTILIDGARGQTMCIHERSKQISRCKLCQINSAKEW